MIFMNIPINHVQHEWDQDHQPWSPSFTHYLRPHSTIQNCGDICLDVAYNQNKALPHCMFFLPLCNILLFKKIHETKQPLIKYFSKAHFNRRDNCRPFCSTPLHEATLRLGSAKLKQNTIYVAIWVYFKISQNSAIENYTDRTRQLKWPGQGAPSSFHWPWDTADLAVFCFIF